MYNNTGKQYRSGCMSADIHVINPRPYLLLMGYEAYITPTYLLLMGYEVCIPYNKQTSCITSTPSRVNREDLLCWRDFLNLQLSPAQLCALASRSSSLMICVARIRYNHIRCISNSWILQYLMDTCQRLLTHPKSCMSQTIRDRI